MHKSFISLSSCFLVLVTAAAGAEPRCNASLWQHTYHRERFTVISSCRQLTGTVTKVRMERDGDAHVLIRLDAGQGEVINDRNRSAQHGCLVVEPVCVGRVRQADAVGPCAGVTLTAVPRVGAHVRVKGVYALDKPHGWMEIHAAEIEPAP